MKKAIIEIKLLILLILEGFCAIIPSYINEYLNLYNIYSQKSKMALAAGIAYFSPLSKVKVIHTKYSKYIHML